MLSFKKLFLTASIIFYSLTLALIAQSQTAPVAVTVAEYCGFLNAVAKTDTYGLYNPKMGSDADVASIARSGAPGHYKYKVINDALGNGASPITYVTQLAAARFCNWMENHQAVGNQGVSTTETGTYDLTSIDQGTSDLLPLAISGAVYFLPNDYLFNTQSSQADGENCAPSVACNFIGFYIAKFSPDASTTGSSSSSGNGAASSSNPNNSTGFFGGLLGQDIIPPAPLGSGATTSSSSGATNTNAVPTGTVSTNLVNIALVPVNYAGNNADTSNATFGNSGFGAVPFNYQIGTFDVTAEQYCAFLNAVAKTDPHALYDTNMASDTNVACITRSVDANNNYVYALTSSNVAKLPITYVSWFAATRFCNWLENGEPVGDEGPATTESGAFNSGIAVPGAKWSLPTETQWYKAAYYVPPSTNYPAGTYDIFGTGANTAPGNKWEDAVVANNANYSLNGTPTTSTAPRLTPVGSFTNSATPCGAYDMAGNVDQWTGSFDATGNNVIIRGGSWNSQTSNELSSSSRRTNAVVGNATTGFRVVYNVPVPVAISKISIDLVPVRDPGNDADIALVANNPTFGAVQKSYQIGTYDVTADQYCMFLNAVAATDDPHFLYNTNMAADPDIASIIRSGTTNNYVYSVIPGREKLPITYVRWFATIRFCNWLENGQPIGIEDINTTESGSFNADTNGTFFAETNAIWSLPTENQWYKAAYYHPVTPDNPIASYWVFGTAANIDPDNRLANAALPDGVNYDLGGTTRADNFTTPGLPRLTPVGTFTKSASSYGAYDMAGNVDQWTLGIGSDRTSLAVRGGSWASTSSDDLQFSSSRFVKAAQASSTIGFRIVYNVEPPPPPAPTIIQTIKSDGKKAGSVVWSDIKTITKDIRYPSSTTSSIINSGFNYMIGGSIAEGIAWILNMGIKMLDSFFTFLAQQVRYWLGEGAMDWFQGWIQSIYNIIFSSVDRSGQMAAARAAARIADTTKTEKLFNNLLTQSGQKMRVRENRQLLLENGGIDDAATATTDAALAGATDVAISAEAAVVAEAALGSFFASPLAAVLVPAAVLWASAEMVQYGDPRYGIGCAGTGLWFAYNAIKLLF